MAYQPKSYRKFVATAATATLVATAVTPAFAAENLPFGDVNKNYAEAVGALYSKNIVSGISKTEFGTYKNLTRGDAAVIIAKAKGLDTKNAPDAGFKDVNSRIKGAVNALVAEGIINGVSKDKFDPDAPLTRGAMAKILVNAYNLKDYAKETPFTDLTSTFKPYVEALYGAGITKGKGSTYGTNEKITRGDFANMLYKAMNIEAPKAESIKALDDITVDEGTKLEDVKLPEKVTVVYSDKSEKEASVKWDTSKLDTSKPDTYKLEGTVDGTDLKASVNVVVKAVAPKVESVSAINSKTLEVKFSKPVDDTKAKFDVKRGSITANISNVTWSEDKKAVKLELASKLFAGDYTVNVTGLTDQALTGTAKVENEKVAKIEIASDLAVLSTDNDSVKVGYKVYNQYGEDITAKTTINATSSSGTTSVDAAKGIITITGLTNPKAGDKLSLTLVHPETATATSKVLTVSEASKVSDVTIEGLYNADNKELSEDTKDNDFYLLINAKDQYGNEMTASDLNASSVVVNSSNPLVAKATANDFKEITVDGKKRIALKLDTSTATAGKSTVSIISLASAKVAQYDVEVKEGAKVDNLVLSQPELAVAKEKVVIPFEAYDKQGNKVDKYDLLKAVQVTSTAGNVKFVKDAKTNDTNLVLDLTNVDNPTKVTVTAITPTQKVVNLVVDVKEAAKPVYISGVKDVTTNVEAGQKFEIGLSNIVVKDQYDREFTLTDKVGTNASQYQIKAQIPTDSQVLGFDKDGSNNPLDTIKANDDKITVKGSAKGTETLKLMLADNTGSPIPGSELDIPSRVAASDEYVSYEVKAIDPLYDDSKVDIDATTDTDTYVRDVVVYGVLANGQKVVLPSSAYTVTSPTKGIEVIQPDSSHGYQLNVQAAETSGIGTSQVQYDKDATEAKGTAVITINANGQQLTQDFTITQAKPKVASAKFDTTKVNNGVANVADSSGNITADDLFGLVNGATVEDQYGETVQIDPATGAITFKDSTTASSSILISDYTSVGTANHTIVKNGTSSVAISGADNDETFKATFNFGGYQVPVKVVVGD